MIQMIGSIILPCNPQVKLGIALYGPVISGNEWFLIVKWIAETLHLLFTFIQTIETNKACDRWERNLCYHPTTCTSMIKFVINFQINRIHTTRKKTFTVSRKIHFKRLVITDPPGFGNKANIESLIFDLIILQN